MEWLRIAIGSSSRHIDFVGIHNGLDSLLGWLGRSRGIIEAEIRCVDIAETSQQIV